MANYLTISEAATLLDVNVGTVRRRCIAGKFAGAQKQKGAWMIPVTADEKLRTPQHLIGSDELSHLPVRKREEALKKLGIINECERYAATAVRGGANRKAAIEIYCKTHGMTIRTYYRWHKSYRLYGLAGLVDTRGVADVAEPAFSDEASNELLLLYLDENKLSLKQCYQAILHKNNSESHDWQIPSLRSIYNWVEKNVPEPVIVLKRQGQAAYEAKCCPYIQADPDSFAPGECWVGDHHQMNFFIRYRNKWVRPWLTCWEDMRSRTIVGWYLSANPNQTTVLLAMRNGIEHYGPPHAVKIDNGKDYDSQMFTGTTKAKRKSKGYLDETMVTGLYAMMDISVTFSIPYHPQSKPIERLFATVDIQFSRTIDTWCGKDIASKPEGLADKLKSQKTIDSAYDFESLAEVLGRWVEVYNNTVHTGQGMDGRTPAQVMATRVSKRVISEDVLDMLMCVWSGDLKIGKNGVRFKNMLYGQYEPRLLQRFDKIVRVSYNPADLRSITVYDTKSMRRICIAEQNQLIKYGQPVAEEAMREAQRQKAAIVKAHKNWVGKRDKQHLGITELTIQAMDEAVKSNKPTETTAPSIRPVKTVLDLQVNDHNAERRRKVLKKAAGAEDATVIDIDLSAMGNGPKGNKIKLFNA